MVFDPRKRKEYKGCYAQQETNKSTKKYKQRRGFIKHSWYIQGPPFPLVISHLQEGTIMSFTTSSLRSSRLSQNNNTNIRLWIFQIVVCQINTRPPRWVVFRWKERIKEGYDRSKKNHVLFIPAENLKLHRVGSWGEPGGPSKSRLEQQHK